MANEAHLKKLDQETEKFKKKEQERLIIDYDKAVEEERSKAIIVKFDGEEYELPSNAPAWLLDFMDNKIGEEIPDQENLRLVKDLLGDELASKIMDRSNKFASLESVNNIIIEPVMAHWGFDITDSTNPQQEGQVKNDQTSSS